MAPNNANKVDVTERLKEEYKEWEKTHPDVSVLYFFTIKILAILYIIDPVYFFDRYWTRIKGVAE